MINYSLNSIEKKIAGNYWTPSIGLARTLIALATFLTLLCNDFNIIFPDSIISGDSTLHPKLSLSIYSWFSDFRYAYFISLVVLIISIIGWFPRFFCVFHWLVTYSFFHSSSAADGGDQIASIITLFLIPIFIFDSRKSHWSISEKNKNFYINCVAFLALELLKFQIFVIYFIASVGKFKFNIWNEGTALYYWFTEPLFGPKGFKLEILKFFILDNHIILTLTTWIVLILELFIAFSYFSKKQKIKNLTLIFGVLFHLLIAIIFGLVSFFLVMTSCLIIFTYSKNKDYEHPSIIYRRFFSYFSNLLHISAKKN